MPSSTPVSQSVADTLIALGEAESDSLLQRLREPLPVLARCSDHVRSILLSLEADRTTRQGAVRTLLSSWHLKLHPGNGPDADPFFALLSMRFLLLKIAEAQALLRSRYGNALATLPAATTSPELATAITLLTAHQQNIRDGYDRLDRELKAMGLEPAPEV